MKDDGGPAFPVPAEAAQLGMSLRDWLAGMVASGILLGKAPTGATHKDIADTIAATAYIVADAMLVERSKINEG